MISCLTDLWYLLDVCAVAGHSAVLAALLLCPCASGIFLHLYETPDHHQGKKKKKKKNEQKKNQPKRLHSL